MHRLEPWVTGARHDKHFGGTIISMSARLQIFTNCITFTNWNFEPASATSSSMTETSPQIFDRELYLARQSKANATHDLQNMVAAELGDRLSIILKQFPKALVIAQNPQVAAETLKLMSGVERLDVLAPPSGDALELPDSEYDAIFSLLDLHCVNDVPGHLAQLARGLKPDGLLLVAFFAGDTLFELREAWLQSEIEVTGGVSPRVAPMIGVRELGGLMQRAGLALPVADLDRTIVRYADAFALMGEVKNFGYSNPLCGRSLKLVSKRFISKVAEHYHQHFADEDGRVRATLEIAWAMAWKPHGSQPKPLKPGSASHRLADILKDQA
jgi:SAM-dependent methyltransferase